MLLVLANRTLAQSQSDVRMILDSLEVLKKVGGYVDGYTYPPTAEETRYYNITRMLFSLPFAETKKLMADNNKFARVYGFLVTTKSYFDSLTKSDLQIFNDTANLPVYTQRGIVELGITVGQYCEMAYSSAIEENKTTAKEQKVIAAVENFIKANSKYPESYEPIDFTNYEDDKGLSFEIQHKYKLKQADGNEIETMHYFVLDKDFRIILIETTRSNTYRVESPELEEWTNNFGKTN